MRFGPQRLCIEPSTLTERGRCHLPLTKLFPARFASGKHGRFPVEQVASGCTQVFHGQQITRFHGTENQIAAVTDQRT